MSKHNGDQQPHDIEPELLTAYALGQLHGEELAAAEAALSAASDQSAQSEIRQIQALAAALSAARNAEPAIERSASLRAAIEERLNKVKAGVGDEAKITVAKPAKTQRKLALRHWAMIGGVLILLIVVVLPAIQLGRESARRMQAGNHLRQIGMATQNYRDVFADLPSSARSRAVADRSEKETDLVLGQIVFDSQQTGPGGATGDESGGGRSTASSQQSFRLEALPPAPVVDPSAKASDEMQLMVTPRIILREESEHRLGINSPTNAEALGSASTASLQPLYKNPATPMSVAGRPGAQTVAKNDGSVALGDRLADLQNERKANQDGYSTVADLRSAAGKQFFMRTASDAGLGEASGTEQYEPIVENAFLSPLTNPLSTFSIDVDTASYANVRRFLTSGRLPPPSAVRIEELVNYFRYDYPQPAGEQPFSANMEVAACPWQEGHLLLRVGLKGKEVKKAERPQSNMVFLLDVSGSMADANKLPLLKTAMQMLVRELGENDRVSIVTYAGQAGLRLPPTRGHEQEKISGVIESLQSGGSTNGSAGIELAYEQAAAYFVTGGTNRVILCTDGDLNVGVTSDDALVKLIKKKAASGTFLTVLGFGEGNLKDAKMEKLADNGNGLYAYIDSVREARKVLVEQLTGSTITIAKDVKIQIEFNPAQIASYRLLGYENRILAAQDFNNDKKDAGEIGAGHMVTALYELVPVGAASEAVQPQPGTDPLKYQGSGGVESRKSKVETQGEEKLDGSPTLNLRPSTFDSNRLTDAAKSGELLTLKLRYKEPTGETSKLLEVPLKDRGGSFHSASPDLQFAAAVASFGMILRNSEHRGNGNLAAVAEIASGALGNDPGGYRAEFVDLVRKAQTLGAK